MGISEAKYLGRRVMNQRTESGDEGDLLADISIHRFGIEKRFPSRSPRRSFQIHNLVRHSNIDQPRQDQQRIHPTSLAQHRHSSGCQRLGVDCVTGEHERDRLRGGYIYCPVCSAYMPANIEFEMDTLCGWNCCMGVLPFEDYPTSENVNR